MILTTTLNPALDALVYVRHLQWHAKNIATEKHLFLSGKGFNVAKMLGRLGVETTALGFVGGGDLEAYRQVLEPLGVQLAATLIAATRTNLKIIEMETGLETEINEAGVPVMEDELADFRRAFRKHLPQAEWLIMSGSVAPNIPVTIYGDLIREARAAGAHTLLDTSGEALRGGAAAIPSALRINLAELSELSGEELKWPGPAARAAGRIVATGMEVVVVSLGGAGALLVHRTGCWLATPPTARAVNAVGAGDVMSAGFVEALQRRVPPQEALRWATALASASVETLETGAVEVQRARELEQEIRVERL